MLSAPLAYPFARSNRDVADFVNAWIELKKNDGSIETLVDYWILGKETKKRPKRWSVIHDVLSWVD